MSWMLEAPVQSRPMPALRTHPELTLSAPFYDHLNGEIDDEPQILGQPYVPGRSPSDMCQSHFCSPKSKSL